MHFWPCAKFLFQTFLERPQRAGPQKCIREFVTNYVSDSVQQFKLHVEINKFKTTLKVLNKFGLAVAIIILIS